MSNQISDQFPTDKARKIVAAMRASMRRDAHAYPEAKFLADLSGYIKDLEALLPQRPTLADMTGKERSACRWMQCDYAGETSDFTSPGVIGYFDHGDRKAVILTPTCGIVRRDYDRVTPRPDLPRLAWPGTEKPAPALPGDWRFADHPDHGCVIVANPTPNRAGNVCFVMPAVDGDPRGFTWHICSPNALTYIDQEDNQ